jgi:multimeric flavodoxin WrbA
MRILGLSCGSTGGNSELLLKIALRAAEEAGLTAELVRVGDLALPGARPGTLAPGTPDDRPWLVEKLVACDALIVSAAVYSRSPSVTLKMLSDRAFGPRVDVAAVIRARQGKQNGDPRHATTVVDERVLKPRVGGFISVGGASSADWATFGLPLMHQATFSMQIAMVDQISVLGAPMPGTVLFDEAAVARAAQLGRHVAAETGKPFDEAVYHGAPGVCPICHCDLVIPHLDADTECATCAARGTLEASDGRMRLNVTEEGRRRSILSLEGKFHHQDEIDAVGGIIMPRLREVPALRAEIDRYDRLVAPETATP